MNNSILKITTKRHSMNLVVSIRQFSKQPLQSVYQPRSSQKASRSYLKRLDNTTTSNATNNSTRGRGTSRGNFRGRNFDGRSNQSRGFRQNCGNFNNDYNSQNYQFGLTTLRQATGTTHTTTIFHSSNTNNHSGTRPATINRQDGTTAVSSPIHCRTCNAALGHTSCQCGQPAPAQYGTQPLSTRKQLNKTR